MDALDVFQRCINGKPYTKDFKTYSKKFLESTLNEL